MWHIGGMPIVERNRVLVVNSILWTLLTLVFTTMRLFTRAFVVRRLGMDDYLMTTAMCFSIAYLVTIMYQIKHGLGQPVNLSTLMPFIQTLFSTVILYNVTQTLYKLSIITQTYRLFRTIMGKRVIQVIIAWILVCGIMAVSGFIFTCRPVAKFWDATIPGHCFNPSALQYSISGLNIVNDLMLIAIPTPLLVQLKILRKRKIVLISSFTCGVLVTVVSIMRLKALYIHISGLRGLAPSMSSPYIANIKQQVLTHLPYPLTCIDVALWSGIEINGAIICGSVPALKAFISRVILRHSHNDFSDRPCTPNSALRRHRAKGGSPDVDEFSTGIENGAIEIRVHRDVELKAFKAVDNDGSESHLITQNNSSV